jgi:hypothetical protein
LRCGLPDGLGLAFADNFFFFPGVAVGASSGDFDAFFSDGEAEGEAFVEAEGFGLVFFFGDGDGDVLWRLCGVGVGVAKIFLTRSPNESDWAATGGGRTKTTSAAAESRQRV